MIRNGLLILAVAGGWMGAGCKQDESSPGSVTSHIEQVFREPDIQGKVFASACSERFLTGPATGLLTGVSINGSQLKYSFTGDKVERINDFYQNSDCSGPVAFSYREIGSFKIMEDRKTADNATFIDFHFDRLNLKISNEAGATAANGVNLCGAADWRPGDERDITAHAGDINCYAHTYPRIEANVYRVDGDTLTLGDGSLSPGGRPTSLSSFERYQRQ